MALNWDSATYGRDKAGLDKIIGEIKTKTNELIKLMDPKSNGYQGIEKVIKKYWVGVDADNFLETLKAANKKSTDAVKSIQGQISTDFIKDEKEFAKFQEGNKLVNSDGMILVANSPAKKTYN